MDAILKLITLINGVSEALPQLVAAVKSTLSEEDEAKLKAEIAAMQAKNSASYVEAHTLLTHLASGKQG